MPNDYDVDTDDLPSMDEYDTGRFVLIGIAIVVTAISTDARNRSSRMSAHNPAIRLLDWNRISKTSIMCR